MNILQECINELNSFILEELEDKIKLTGFMNKDRLYDYYERGVKCHYSQGVFPLSKYNVGVIPNKGEAIIIDENNNEIKYSFVTLFSDAISYKKDDRQFSQIVIIRKNTYSTEYNFQSSTSNLIFNNSLALDAYIKEAYGIHINYIKEEL